MKSIATQSNYANPKWLPMFSIDSLPFTPFTAVQVLREGKAAHSHFNNGTLKNTTGLIITQKCKRYIHNILIDRAHVKDCVLLWDMYSNL